MPNVSDSQAALTKIALGLAEISEARLSINLLSSWYFTEQVAVVVLMGGFFFLGSMVIGQTFMALIQGYTSKRWPKTIGTIIESRVEEQVNADGQFLFFPQVRYRYMVQGHTYESATIRFPTQASPSRRRAETAVLKYPTATSVPVAYLPQSLECLF